MLAVLIIWVVYENRRLLAHAARINTLGRVQRGEGKAMPRGGTQVQPATTPKEA
jgi:hypothetical protein